MKSFKTYSWGASFLRSSLKCKNTGLSVNMIASTLTVIRHDIAVVMRMYWSVWVVQLLCTHVQNVIINNDCLNFVPNIKGPKYGTEQFTCNKFFLQVYCVCFWCCFMFEGKSHLLIWTLLLYRYFKQSKEMIWWFVKKSDKYPLVFYASCRQCTSWH